MAISGRRAQAGGLGDPPLGRGKEPVEAAASSEEEVNDDDLE